MRTMSDDNLTYYSRRAAQEMAASEAASTDAIAEIHRTLAKRFSELAAREAHASEPQLELRQS